MLNEVIHVVNFTSALSDSRLSLCQDLMCDLEPPAGVRRIACSSTEIDVPGWEPVALYRDARILGEGRDLPFLRDLLKIGLCRARHDRDLILVTNLDCVMPPHSYQKLLHADVDFVEFMRLDVEDDLCCDYDIFSTSNTPFTTGVDGFAVRKSLMIKVLPKIPDFVIGSVGWDNFVSGLRRCISKYVPGASTACDRSSLYHIKHETAYNHENLRKADRHNVELYLNSVVMGHIDSTRIEPESSDEIVAFIPATDIERNADALLESRHRWDRQTIEVHRIYVCLTGCADYVWFSSKIRSRMSKTCFLEEIPPNKHLNQDAAIVGWIMENLPVREPFVLCDGLCSGRSDWVQRGLDLLANKSVVGMTDPYLSNGWARMYRSAADVNSKEDGFLDDVVGGLDHSGRIDGDGLVDSRGICT